MTEDYQSVHINRSFILTGGLMHSLIMTGDYQSVHINRSFILTGGLIHSLTIYD